MAKALNSVGCLLYPENVEKTNLQLPVSSEISDFMTTFMDEGWYLRDHRATRGWPLIDAGRPVIIEHDVANDEERRTGAYYHELLLPHDLLWWAAVAIPVNGSRWCLPLLRSPSQGPYTPSEAIELTRLAPYLSKVVSLAEKFAISRGAAALDALSQIGSAAVLVDRQKRCLKFNAAAEALFGPALSLSNGRLVAADHATDARLQRLVDAVGCSHRSGGEALTEVVVTRRDDRPLLVEAFPVTGALSDAFFGAAALLTISVIGAAARPAPATLQSAFRLTPAEAKLTALLASGKGISEASSTLAITRETARSQLKAVFAKMGVTRQAELVSLIANIGARRR